MPRRKKVYRAGSNLPESKQTIDFKLPYSVIDNIRKLPAGEKHQFSGNDDDEDDICVVGCHLNADFFSLIVTGGKKEGDLIKCHIRDVCSSSPTPSTLPSGEPSASSGQTGIFTPEENLLMECKQESAAPDTPPLAVVTSGFVTSPEHLELTTSKEANSVVKTTRRAVNTRRLVKRQAGSSAEDESPEKGKKSRNSKDNKEKTKRGSNSRVRRVHIKEEQVGNAEDTSLEYNESSSQLTSELDNDSSRTNPKPGRRTKLAEWLSANPLFEFNCKMCSFQIRSRSEFLVHLKSHDKSSRQYISDFNVDPLDLTTVRDQQRVQCKMCEASYLDLEILVKHTNTIHKDDPRRKEQLISISEHRWSQVRTGILQDCPYCTKTYSGRRILSHLKLVHPEEPDFEEKLRIHTVALDKEKSKQQNLARKKARSDTPKSSAVAEIDVICPYCAKQMRPHYLPRHMKLFCKESVRDKRVYKCPCCEFRTYEMTEWQRHKAAEHERLMVCQVCGKSLGSKSALSHHIRFKHGILNKKPLSYKVCPTCNKRFESKSQLDRHMPTHSNYREKTECECSVCERTFRDKSGLYKHMQQVHHNIYPHYCPKCGHGLKNQQKLRAHRCGRVRRKSNHLLHDMNEVKQGEESPEVTEDCYRGYSSEVAVKTETTDSSEMVYVQHVQQVQLDNEATVNVGEVEYDSYILMDDGPHSETKVITVEAIDQSEYSVMTAAAAVEFVDG